MSERFDLKFVNNCRAILETLRDVCSGVPNPPVEPAIFDMISLALEHMNPENMIKYYANETHEFWDKVAEHDEAFICSNVEIVINSVKIDDGMRGMILSIINSHKMAEVVKLMKLADKRLKQQGTPDEDLNLNYVWRAMESLVRLSIKYTIAERTKNPKAVPNATYDLSNMAARWIPNN
jgi:hypothetical protein